MPRPMKGEKSELLASYPDRLTKTLKVVLMSLDITEYHPLSRGLLMPRAEKLAKQGSPLAQWVITFMTPMLNKLSYA